ncbi:hypothetical protein ACFXG4_35075 [Nocardia sp. NPDC059246]|uniref:hypothetical protein n=1 Tax=unclassified Nocardia TaxID=2637762 RepID=UPI0036C923CD
MVEPIHALGPIQLSIEDQSVGLGAIVLRTSPARLAAAGGRATSTDRLIDDLREGNPPPTGLSMLQVHIRYTRD